MARNIHIVSFQRCSNSNAISIGDQEIYDHSILINYPNFESQNYPQDTITQETPEQRKSSTDDERGNESTKKNESKIAPRNCITITMWKFITEEFRLNSDILDNLSIVGTFKTFIEILSNFDLSTQNAPDILFGFLCDVLRLVYTQLSRVRMALCSMPDAWNAFINLPDDYEFSRVVLEANGCDDILGQPSLQNFILISIIQSFKYGTYIKLTNLLVHLITTFPLITQTNSRLALCLDTADIVTVLQYLMPCPLAPSESSDLVIAIWIGLVAPVTLDELCLWNQAHSVKEAYQILDCILSRLQTEAIGMQHLNGEHYRRFLKAIAHRKEKDSLRFLFLGVLAMLASELGNQAACWELSSMQVVDRKTMNSTFNCIELTVRYLEMGNQSFTEYQRGSVVQHVLAMLGHLLLPSPVFIGTFALLDPLVWPHGSGNSKSQTSIAIHNIKYQDFLPSNKEAVLAFVGGNGYNIVTKVTHESHCPMQYLALCFKLLVASLVYEQDLLHERSEQSFTHKAKLIQNFLWYFIAATDCTHLKAGLIPTAESPPNTKKETFKYLSEWPCYPSDLTDRILFALTEANQDEINYKYSNSLRRDFFTLQSWNRISVILELSLYGIDCSYESAVMQTFQKLLADTITIFEREVELRNKEPFDDCNEKSVNCNRCGAYFKCNKMRIFSFRGFESIRGFCFDSETVRHLDQIIEYMGDSLSSCRRVETASEIFKWFHRATEYWNEGNLHSGCRWNLLRKSFHKFIASLGLYKEFYNPSWIEATRNGAGYLNLSLDRLIHADFRFVVTGICRPDWDKLFEVLSPRYSWKYYESLILIPLYTLRLRASTIIEQTTTKQTSHRHPRSNDSYQEQFSPFKEASVNESPHMDKRSSFSMEFSSKTFIVTLNKLRGPLLCIQRCFSTVLNCVSKSEVDVLGVFTMTQVLKSFEAVRCLLSYKVTLFLHEVKDQLALLLGTFLIVIDSSMNGRATVELFLKLNGRQLLTTFLEYFRVDDSLLLPPNRNSLKFNAQLMRHQQRSLISGEMGSLKSRLLNVLSIICEESVLDSQLTSLFFGNDFFTMMISNAQLTLQLSIFNSIATPFITSEYQDEILTFCPWNIIINTLLDCSLRQLQMSPSIREESFTLIHQILEYEHEQVFSNPIYSLHSTKTNLLKNGDRYRDVVYVNVRFGVKERVFANYLKDETSLIKLLPCCRRVADSTVLLGLGGGRSDQITQRCPICHQLRAKEQVVFWACNEFSIVTALNLKQRFMIDDDASVIRWLKLSRLREAGEGHGEPTLEVLKCQMNAGEDFGTTNNNGINNGDEIITHINPQNKPIQDLTSQLLHEDSRIYHHYKFYNLKLKDLPLICYDIVYSFLTTETMISI